MKRTLSFLLIVGLLVLTTLSATAQNTRNFYYIIRKKDMDNGRLKIIYRDPNDSVQTLKMCYPELKAEGFNLEDGVPVFHFKRIPSSQHDADPTCISNNTPLGRFEIDVHKRRIGEPHTIAKIPFRSVNWNASLTLYKIRFAQEGHPVLAVSDPASMLISVVYGYTFGFSRIDHESVTHYYVTFGPFAGITSASLNGDTVSEPLLLSREQNNVAFSYGITTVVGRNNFGFSFSFG